MLAVRSQGPSPAPTLVFLHWLGGTARSWDTVAERLAPHGLRSIAVALPGFGESADVPPCDTHAMARAVEETLAAELDPSQPYVLVGHSMGGKVAMLLTHWRERDGRQPSGLMLVSSSTPSPEPMTEAKRAEVTRELGSAEQSGAARAAYARKFVEDNTGKYKPLAAARDAEAERMLMSAPAAFALWMEQSSKEDVRGELGAIETRALVLAGSADAALGPNAQREWTLPLLKHGRLETLEGAGHLAPLERPEELAWRILSFLRECGVAVGQKSSSLGPAFQQLVRSELTSEQTRAAMEGRLGPRSMSGFFGPELSLTLEALVRAVIPEAGFDLAARLEQVLQQGQGDGWRFALLPCDQEAWRLGLKTLDHLCEREFGVNFAALRNTDRAEVLKRVGAGKASKGVLGALHLGKAAEDEDGAKMKQWFEDVRAELVKLYAADPRTMERVGFEGFADNDGFDVVSLAPAGRLA